MLFACYRRDEAHDPEMYCAAVSAVLSEYASAIVDYVTDPRTGLPSSQKFLPSVAEVREALEDRARQIERDGGYQSRVAEQLRLRDEWKKPRSPEEIERRKASARAWLDRTDPVAQQLSGKKTAAQLGAEAKARLEAQYGIDLVDATPDAPRQT